MTKPYIPSQAPEQPPARQAPPPYFLIAVGVGLAAAALALIAGGPTTKIVVTLVVVTTLLGAWRGALETAAFVVALLLAAIIAFPLGRALENQVGSTLNLTGLDKRGASIGLAALAVLVVASLITGVIAKRLKKKLPALAKADRPAGAALGLFEGVFLSFLVVWGALAIQPTAQKRVDDFTAAREAGDAVPASSLSERLARGVVSLADDAASHPVGSLAASANPIAEMEAFVLAEDYLDILNHPEALRAFQESDALRRIQDNDAFKRAVETLKQDPAVRAALEHGLDSESFAAIRRSDAVLGVIDDPELIRETERLTEELKAALEEARSRIRSD